ncbi:MAG TPA: LLM class flavin-dependent oxidoreductase [Tepidiformaceae bacterium]|nr:LLM class flavin-dependent oxidoreductase [Tepidiformaceae bacterium]
MRYGFVLPSGNARTAADFAHEAEAAGWDGFFVWEPIWGNDAWVSLAAAAMTTSTIRLGTMLTPLSRMRPWKLASETASVDNLSGGRVILAVGLGATDTGFEAFGEVTDRRQRAELLDEGLDILTGLWRGQPFSYSGKHYTVGETSFQPPDPPVQQPRIPIWVVGAWPRPKSMRRALRYDGILPNVMDESGEHRQAAPADITAIAEYVREHRWVEAPFEIIQEGQTPGDDPEKAAAIVRPWAEAGATWWLEAMWDQPFDDWGRAAVLQRVKQGPPRI